METKCRGQEYFATIKGRSYKQQLIKTPRADPYSRCCGRTELITAYLHPIVWVFRRSESKIAERKTKGEDLFRDAYDSARVLRDTARGAVKWLVMAK